MTVEKMIMFERFDVQYSGMKGLFDNYPIEDCMVVLSRYLVNRVQGVGADGEQMCSTHEADLWKLWNSMLESLIQEGKEDGGASG